MPAVVPFHNVAGRESLFFGPAIEFPGVHVGRRRSQTQTAPRPGIPLEGMAQLLEMARSRTGTTTRDLFVLGPAHFAFVGFGTGRADVIPVKAPRRRPASEFHGTVGQAHFP